MISALTPHEEEARLEARRLADGVLGPQAEGWEEREELPSDVIRELCALGFGAAVLPREAGGAGLSHVGALAVFEELARGDMTAAFVLLCQNSCCRSIWRHGNEEQRARWLPALAAGEVLGAYVITEPEAGSDPASMRTTAREVDGGFVLDGKKSLISNAPVAGVFLVSAKTEPELGARGVSSFLIGRGTPGLETGERQRTLGARALQLGELSLRNCRVERDALLGERGHGFKIALDAVNFARVVWGALSAGLARAVLDQALEHLGRRKQFGRALVEFQAVQFQLADLATAIEVARLLAYRAAELMDRGEDAIAAAAMTKLFAGDMAVRVTSEALELLGGAGYLVPSPLERYLRQARMAQLADGTSNIQRHVIARSLL